MGDILRKPYEISVWEDVLVTENDVTYYKENKIAVIGSDTMDSPNRVYDPVLQKSINGEVTLTFSLKYKYYDPQTEQMVHNPFESYLINERKVKLFYDDEWYDFIIRNHEETDGEYEWSYTLQDAFILELSKNGYNIELAQELGNNQGTATQLAKTALKDTDWIVDEEHSSILKQLLDEPIYHAVLGADLEGIEIINVSGDGSPIPEAGSEVYVFYSYVAGKNGDFVQIIQPSEEELNRPNTNGLTGIDDRGNILTANFRINTPLIFDDTDGQAKFKAMVNEQEKIVLTIGVIETQYHAYRLVYNQLTTYDNVMKRTVELLNVEPNDIAYRYKDYTYSTSDVVVPYVTNGDNFELYSDGRLQGWSEFTDCTGDLNQLNVIVFPQIESGIRLVDLTQYAQNEAYLKIKFKGINSGNYKNTIFNSGIEDNASLIGSIARGQKFLFRWRAGMTSTEDKNIGPLGSNQFGAIVAKYKTKLSANQEYYISVIDPDGIILHFNGEEQVLNNYIKTGNFDQEGQYIVDNVVQTPSTKYIYIDKDDTTEPKREYIWNRETQAYELKNNKFLDYRYLTAEALQSVSNAELIDPTTQIGIFIYLRGNANINRWYYVQDVQLTKYFEDAQHIPVTVGNIPTATSTETTYYYLKPKEGQTETDVELYTSLEAFARSLGVSTDKITLAYNENSEKMLTISESHSNCFNILQSIAETFEAWLKIQVEHENDGSIKLDENKKPIKKILFKDFAGSENYAGFKYGTNLKSITRTIDSDEIITKLIVDQAQSDYVDKGIVSIQDAKSNASGESYIFNFDYFYNNGLMDIELSRPKVEQFNLSMRLLNNQLNELNKTKADLEMSLIKINSTRTDITTLIETAKQNINIGRTDFKKTTGQDYDEYQKLNITEDTYVLTTDETVDPYKTYYVKNGTKYQPVSKPAPTDNPKTKGWYIKVLDLLADDKIVELIGEIYVNSTMINNYSGLLTNIEKEYNDLNLQLHGTPEYSFTVSLVDNYVRLYLSDYVIPFKFTYNGIEYYTDVNRKAFDDLYYIAGQEINITEFLPGYKIYTSDGSELVGGIAIDPDRVQKFKLKAINEVQGYDQEIQKCLDRKNELAKDFYKRFSRFVQEGTWSSTNYTNSDLYYLDAMQVSNVSSKPKISYSIDVVEISALEGFENYNFDVGDRTWIEDEEFFGWNPLLQAPIKEEVIVSEVEWHLDEPQDNTVTIQNYKTQFEDLFQRINATVQMAQYNEVSFAKTSSIVNIDGALRQEILINALNDVAGQKYNLASDGSIYVEGDNIYVQNLLNPRNRVIINSEGIRVSDDGGVTWTTAVSGRGVNAGTIYTGSINTDEVVIGGASNPAFRWDKYGLSAYRSDKEGVYDLKSYVRFDEYGLYGIKDGADFRAVDLADIERKAHFGLTWNGFFIKNSYTDGRVEITSDNDFRVIQTVDEEEHERIKIGALDFDEDGNPIRYGININRTVWNEELQKFEDKPAFTTGNDGNITITGTINALGGNFSELVTVGKQDGDNPPPWINIDGANAVIGSSNYGATTGWSIEADGSATFNNVSVRGAIKTATFEYAEIQAVGGAFLFRPSSAITAAEVVEVEETGAPTRYDLIVSVEKIRLFNVNDWCKISNYSDNPATIEELTSLGLKHIYPITRIENEQIIFENVDSSLYDNQHLLVGGCLISMGHYENGITTQNYGIGINSSDNYVNLPRRAISLFETEVRPTDEAKVSYQMRGILGTLPQAETLNFTAGSLYEQHMENTQGIYTDNMYIGNEDQYITFYTDQNDNKKHLKISARDIVYEVKDGQEISWNEHIENIADEEVGKEFDNRLKYFWQNLEGTPTYPAGTYMAGGLEKEEPPVIFDKTKVETYGYNTFMDNTSLNFRYNDEVLTKIGKDGIILGDQAALHLQITSDKIAFLNGQDTEPVSYIESNKLYIPYSVVLNEMQMGEEIVEDPVTGEDIKTPLWAWKTMPDRHLRLVWLGKETEENND